LGDALQEERSGLIRPIQEPISEVERLEAELKVLYRLKDKMLSDLTLEYELRDLSYLYERIPSYVALRNLIIQLEYKLKSGRYKYEHPGVDESREVLA